MLGKQSAIDNPGFLTNSIREWYLNLVCVYVCVCVYVSCILAVRPSSLFPAGVTARFLYVQSPGCGLECRLPSILLMYTHLYTE